MEKEQYIALATPSRGLVAIDWAGSIRSLAWPKGYGHISFFVVDGDTAEARNCCVEKVLQFETDEREITHIFWLDDDVHPGRLVVPRLLSHGADIVSGVYLTKSEVPETMLFPALGRPVLPFVPNKVFDIWACGLGLVLVKTEVYKRMAQELDLGVDRFGRTAYHKYLGAEAVAFDGGIMKGEMSEDIYFMERARQIGYSPKVDTCELAFAWHYDAKKRIGYPREQYTQLRSGKPIVWNTPEGPVTWG